ncbi:MAG: hypothetical protein KW788_00300 [Candidatus Doudnabacteria bacterium]|nr:hypothetical protein [Candidatus Doudnabacteria bacterium]
MHKPFFRLGTVLALFFGLTTLSCGGSPNTPTPTPTPLPPPVKPEVTLAFYSGANDTPVVGAQVNFLTLGKSLTTSANGEVSLPEPEAGTSLKITASGFLDASLVYDRKNYYLWPLGENGEGYVSSVAFSGEALGGRKGKIFRLNQDVSLIVSEPFRSDRNVMSSLERDAETITQLNREYAFRVVADGVALPGTLAVTVNQGNLGVSYSEPSGSDGLITGDKIYFLNTNSARSYALREFGILLGLNVTSSSKSIFSQYTTTLSPTQEDLWAMRMIVMRKPMAYWKDTDPKFGTK